MCLRQDPREQESRLIYSRFLRRKWEKHSNIFQLHSQRKHLRIKRRIQLMGKWINDVKVSMDRQLERNALFSSTILTCRRKKNMVHNLLLNLFDSISIIKVIIILYYILFTLLFYTLIIDWFKCSATIGWYNRKDLQYMKMEDVIILSAMGPPGGGRTFITNRLVRHFNLVVYTELD